MSSYGIELPNAFGDYTTAQTDTALVAAVTGKVIKVAAVFVNSVVGGIVTFESGGSTAIFEVYPGANGGAVVAAPEGQYLCRTTAGESLTVTTDITGAHSVNVLYRVES